MSKPDLAPESVTLRAGTDLDDNFVYSSWLKSYKRSAGPVPFRWYYKIYQQILDRLYKRPPVQTTIACFDKRPEQIFGYIVWEMVGEVPHIHYVYVKDHFRGMGIGSALIENATSGSEFVYTFRPRKHAPFVKRGGSFSDRYIREDLDS